MNRGPRPDSFNEYILFSVAKIASERAGEGYDKNYRFGLRTRSLCEGQQSAIDDVRRRGFGGNYRSAKHLRREDFRLFAL
jgi:hypothetical protein